MVSAGWSSNATIHTCTTTWIERSTGPRWQGCDMMDAAEASAPTQGPMDLQQRIDADIKAAMLARDKDRLNALRAIKSAILLELTKDGQKEGLDDAAGMRILQKLHKQRMESAAIYRQQDRAELATEEEAQARVIEAYLPARMDEAALDAAVTGLIAELGAAGMKDMGRVMGEANKRLAGKADGSAIAAAVKKRLGGG